MADQKFDPLSESTALLSKWRSPFQHVAEEKPIVEEPTVIETKSEAISPIIEAVEPAWEAPALQATSVIESFSELVIEPITEHISEPIPESIPEQIAIDTVWIAEEPPTEDTFTDIPPLPVETFIAPKAEMEAPTIAMPRYEALRNEIPHEAIQHAKVEAFQASHDQAIPKAEAPKVEIDVPKTYLERPTTPEPTFVPPVAPSEVAFSPAETVAFPTFEPLQPIAAPQISVAETTKAPLSIKNLKPKNSNGQLYSFRERLYFLLGGTIGGIIISSLILPSVFVKFGASMVIILCALTAGVIFWMNEPHKATENG